MELNKNDLAYQKIKQKILDGMITGEMSISETKLVNELHLSRTPIRSALQRLQLEGFLQIFPNQGIRIKELTLEEAKQIYDLRVTLERFLIQKTVPFLTPEDFDELEEMIKNQQIACQKSDLKTFSALDCDFHRFCYKHYKNDVMYSILDNCRDRFATFHNASLKQPKRMDIIIEEHKELLNALRSKEVEPAMDLAEKHVSHGVMSIIVPQNK